MKKRLVFILGVFAFILFNIYASNTFDSKTNITLQGLGNIAIANAEEGGSDVKCWSSMVISFGGRVLECNTPCCYRQDKKAYGDSGGTCSGTFNNC